MEQLIALLASAGPDDQSEVIRAALRFALDSKWITAETYRRANEMCNAGAFLDAALTLVPEGWHVQLFGVDGHGCVSTQSHFVDEDEQKEMRKRGERLHYFPARQNKPFALSMCIAALKARATTGGKE